MPPTSIIKPNHQGFHQRLDQTRSNKFLSNFTVSVNLNSNCRPDLAQTVPRHPIWIGLSSDDVSKPFGTIPGRRATWKTRKTSEITVDRQVIDTQDTDNFSTFYTICNGSETLSRVPTSTFSKNPIEITKATCPTAIQWRDIFHTVSTAFPSFKLE